MKDFNKTAKQVEAINLLAGTAKNIMLFGGSRSGKTFIAVYAIIVRASKVKSRHIMLRLTFNSIKTSIWLDTLPKVISLCFPDLKPKWNKSDYYITLPNGSEIWVGGLDDDKRVEKILGKEYSTMYFNESSQLSYEAVQTAVTRLAEKNDLKKKIYFDCNPPTKKHWSYWLFIKKVNPDNSDQTVDGKNYTSLLMNPHDNLDNIDQDYLDMLKTLPDKQRQRFLEGKFVDGDDGLAYYSFDPEIHVAETRRIGGTIFIGSDFNVNPMCSVVFQVVNNEIHVLDEMYLENSDTFKMADWLTRNDYIGTVIPDSTAKNRKTSGMSDLAILKSRGFVIKSTLNPFVTDRVNNINRLLQEKRIKINPKCKKLINDLNKVSWKDNKLDQKTNPMLTHISDALGYGCWWYEPLKIQKKATTRIY